MAERRRSDTAYLSGVIEAVVFQYATGATTAQLTALLPGWSRPRLYGALARGVQQGQISCTRGPKGIRRYSAV